MQLITELSSCTFWHKDDSLAAPSSTKMLNHVLTYCSIYAQKMHYYLLNDTGFAQLVNARQF